MKKRLILLLTLLLTLTASLAGPSPARAGSDTPLPNMPTANAEVLAIAPDGAGGVYIGGAFTTLTPAGGAAVTRNRIAHIHADGSISAWNPNASDDVYALAVSGNTVYAGGEFTTIGASTRNYIAALDATTGNATTWDPNANNFVYALAVSGNTVYAGGYFTNIGGATRNRIAALDATTGIATAWNPNTNARVRALAVSGNTVYAGGEFTTIGGLARSRIAALDATTGLATTWNPNPDSFIDPLAVSGNTVYAGGEFTTIGASTRNYIVALDATTGNATAWNPNTNAPVYALAVSGNTVYAGGFYSTIGGATRNRIAALDATTGLATTWNPDMSGGAVWVLALSGNTLYAGGTFTTVGGVSRPYFAAFNLVDSTGSSAEDSTGVKWLPGTGFAPNVVTRLPEQPAELAYTQMGDLWLEIPSLKVKANIVGVPQSKNAWDVKWLGQDVGWLNGTAFPTWEGNSVLTAHVTDADGKAGPFANLKNVPYGAQIIVHLYDQQYVFEVSNKHLVRPDTTAFAFQHLEDYSYLTLITCQGYDAATDSYRYRRLIRSVLVEVK
jgi:LPXTG-site transpeptidase (sortase) family protein